MTRSVSPHVGAAFVIGIRLTDRIVGVASTLILARLLLPADFGIIAMASLVINLIEVLLDMGVNVALVQNREATIEDYNAAWTLRLLQSGVATLVIFVMAFPAAVYFHDVRVTPVLQVLAASTLLAGLENIGIVSFQKQMEFGQEFLYFFWKRIAGFIVTTSAALYLQSYWALVIGSLSVRVVGLSLSYVMHPMRPHLSFRRMRPMLSFSSWNLLRGIGGYLNENLHRLIVGRRVSTAIMGSYSLASEITAIPSTELLAPMNRVLFPMLVAARDDAKELKRIFLLAMGVQAMLGVPAGIGLAVVAPELVRSLLGDQWVRAIPFVQIMGGINVVLALSNSSGYLLLALGRAHRVALYSWVQVLLFYMLSVVVLPMADASAIAQLRLCVVVFGLLIFVIAIRYEYPEWRRTEMLACVWRPCLASIVMALVLLRFPAVNALPAILQLLLKVCVGGLSYVVTILLLWRWSGARSGAETYLIARFRGLLKLRMRSR